MLTAAFPSLNAAISSSKVLGLYFSSAWCPDCTPITPALKRVYESQPADKFSVVYVSSDRSNEQMMKSFETSHGNWGVIPFESEERSGLKKKYGACAGAEVVQLGMMGQRKYGIPTLVLIDCETQEVLSFDGVQDVINGDLLNKWGLL
jgi:nucleoredoxin